MSSKRPMDDWFTYREAAEVLGIAYPVFMNRIVRGYVAAVQRGSTWFVHKDEVERLRVAIEAKRARALAHG